MALTGVVTRSGPSTPWAVGGAGGGDDSGGAVLGGDGDSLVEEVGRGLALGIRHGEEGITVRIAGEPRSPARGIRHPGRRRPPSERDLRNRTYRASFAFTFVRPPRGLMISYWPDRGAFSPGFSVLLNSAHLPSA